MYRKTSLSARHWDQTIVCISVIEGIVNNSRIFQNSVSCLRELVLEEDDTEVNVDEGDDNERVTLDTSIDFTLSNLLSSFNVL